MGGVFGSQSGNKILMVGLQASGKTTILNSLKTGRIVTPISTPISTPGINEETFKYQDVIFAIREVDDVKDHWSNHLEDTKAVIFVVDSSVHSNVVLSRAELVNILAEPKIQDAPILVLANKKDLPNAPSKAEITKALKLSTFQDRKWYVQLTCGNAEYSMIEGLHWLANQLKDQ